MLGCFTDLKDVVQLRPPPVQLIHVVVDHDVQARGEVPNHFISVENTLIHNVFPLSLNHLGYYQERRPPSFPCLRYILDSVSHFVGIVVVDPVQLLDHVEGDPDHAAPSFVTREPVRMYS